MIYHASPVTVAVGEKFKHENGEHFEIQFSENRTSFHHPILGGGVLRSISSQLSRQVNFILTNKEL